MEELLKINDKQDMNKYENSIKRIAFNFGLDCLDGKEDQILSEDIKIFMNY